MSLCQDKQPGPLCLSLSYREPVCPIPAYHRSEHYLTGQGAGSLGTPKAWDSTCNTMILCVKENQLTTMWTIERPCPTG